MGSARAHDLTHTSVLDADHQTEDSFTSLSSLLPPSQSPTFPDVLACRSRATWGTVPPASLQLKANAENGEGDEREKAGTGESFITTHPASCSFFSRR